MRLPENTTTGFTKVEAEKRYVHHASAPVYYPAPGGGVYCNAAVCTHDHPDTNEGYTAAEECAERLARIIAQGRLPKWATLVSPLP